MLAVAASFLDNGSMSGTLDILLVEDNERLRPAMKAGLENTGEIKIAGDVASGEEALDFVLNNARPDAILMDVQLAGKMNGIDAAIAIRREFPRMPVVFYSIQDEDEYYRAFRRSGILSHYAYVRKSNYLLPELIVPLLKDAHGGRSFIDSEIETRVLEVRHKDEHAPLDLLEPNEREVAKMLASGMTNEQIAARMGFRDKRTISRVNGQIYTSWGLNDTSTDEKVARTRAAMIYRAGRLLEWSDDGIARAQNENGEWVEWQ